MKVLIIDDDPDIQLITSEALNSLTDYEVISSENSADALEIARRETPDVILLDYNMPQIDGPTFLRKLKADDDENLNRIPVIFFTGESDPSLHESLLAMGAKGVIKKPFSFRELPEALNRILASE